MPISKNLKFLHSETLQLLLLWAITTVFNFNKAVHIDDPAYLYCARAAAVDWLQPYAGVISWGNGKFVALSNITQPALSFYPLALSIWLFGELEIPLHLIQSLYSLLAIFCFYKISKIIGCSFPLAATSLFCLSPAFLPSQNLMTDVPALSFILLSFLLLSRGILEINPFPNYFKAGFIAGLACLIKYSAMVMIPVYFIGVCLKRSFKLLFLLLLPASIILVWSVFTYLDYGGFHINKPQIKEFGTRFFVNSTDWFICLGAISPFSLLFIRTYLSNWLGRFSLLIITLFAILWCPEALSSKTIHYNLNYAGRVFLTNGIIVTIGIVLELIRYRQTFEQNQSWKKIFLLLIVWIISTFFFITLVSRFIAVRHLLLAMPAILLVISSAVLNKTSSFERYLCLLLSITLGALLAISDWHYSDLYRQYAKKFAEQYKNDDNNQIWSDGSWGWQWYSAKFGMKIYVSDSDLKAGDFLIKPSIAVPTAFPEQHQAGMRKIAEITVPSSPYTWFRTMALEPWGGFYASTGNTLPWRISRSPLEKFEVYQYLPDTKNP